MTNRSSKFEELKTKLVQLSQIDSSHDLDARKKLVLLALGSSLEISSMSDLFDVSVEAIEAQVTSPMSLHGVNLLALMCTLVHCSRPIPCMSASNIWSIMCLTHLFTCVEMYWLMQSNEGFDVQLCMTCAAAALHYLRDHSKLDGSLR